MAEVAALVAWWDTNVISAGNFFELAEKPANSLSEAQAREVCGFDHRRISEWRNSRRHSASIAALRDNPRAQPPASGVSKDAPPSPKAALNRAKQGEEP